MLETPNKPSRANIAEQVSLLEKAVQTGRPLAEILTIAGWSYDDLIYDVSGTKAWTGRHPPSIDELRMARHNTPVVSFFTGCGGMDQGLEAAGYRHVAAFEISDLFCKTLRRNRPEWKVFGPPTHSGDVSRFDEVAGVLAPLASIPFEGLFVGGPPCQSFSIAANQRFSKWGANFKRTGFLHETNGNLLFDFVRLIAEFRPRAFVVENVPGLRDLDNGVQLRTAIETLQTSGYRVQEPFVLDAANYNIPQQRLRLFVVGARESGSFKFPVPSLETIGAGSVLNGRAQQLPNNETREHKAESILRYMRLNYGQRDRLGRVDRLDPTTPSKTIIAWRLDRWRSVSLAPRDSKDIKCEGVRTTSNIPGRIRVRWVTRAAIHPGW